VGETKRRNSQKGKEADGYLFLSDWDGPGSARGKGERVTGRERGKEGPSSVLVFKRLDLTIPEKREKKEDHIEKKREEQDRKGKKFVTPFFFERLRACSRGRRDRRKKGREGKKKKRV